MDLNIKIKDIDLNNITENKINIDSQKFWFETVDTGWINDFIKNSAVFDLFKFKISELRSKKHKKQFLHYFLKSGGKVKAVFNNKSLCIGAAIFGNYYLFPRLKEFNIYPPDTDSIFLANIHIDQDYKELGIGKRLLISIQKDVLEKKIYYIESVGKRLNDDVGLADQENTPIMSVKFLINNGFYIKKNDLLYPLLRVDLKSMQKVVTEKEALLEKILLRKQLSKTFLLKKSLIKVCQIKKK